MTETAVAEKIVQPISPETVSTNDNIPLSEPAASTPPPLFDPLRATQTWSQFLNTLFHHPADVVAAQTAFWQKYTRLCENTWRSFGNDHAPAPVIAPSINDRRFKDAAWQQPYFDFLKQSYLLASDTLHQLANTAGKTMPQNDHLRLNMLMKQILAAWAPTNFPHANPEALRAALETNGQNFLRGFDLWQKDADKGFIRRSNANAFVVGQTLAATKGKVVYRNHLIELLQYEPTTSTVYQRPLLIMPPWINRGYILDLQEKNSFVKHAVDAGFTVFMISWVNPTAAHAQCTLDTYARDGLYAALNEIKKITQAPDADVLGYCVGGTLLSAAAARESVEKQKHIHSVTLLTTQTDFSLAGDLLAFISAPQIEDLKKLMTLRGGFLDGRDMSTVFDMLRPEDMIWAPAVRSYFLGLEPQSFDLLFWNDDSVRMPAAMHAQYLEQFYLHNLFAGEGLTLLDTPVRVQDITVPAYIVSCREDHIAPAESVYKGAQQFGGNVRYVSADSGHIAGVVNPPAAQKYAFRAANAISGADLPHSLAHFDATHNSIKGSWWQDWYTYLQTNQKQIKSCAVADKGLGDAPGSYITAA